MGRTLPTFNTYLEHEMAQWAPFRRALRREDQRCFDRLFALAKRHMAEAAYVARPIPFDALVMAILLEQQKTIEAIGNLKQIAGTIENSEQITDERNEEQLQI